MNSNEMYFLILACSAFVSLGVCLVIATVVYKLHPPASTQKIKPH